MSKPRISTALVAVALALSACSTWTGRLFGPDQVIEVSEVGRAMDCAATSPDSSIQMFASADAVRVWQQSSGVQLIGDQSMLAGTYVLVQLGQRKNNGYGLLVGPEAQVDDQRVRLHGTFFDPDTSSVATEALGGPCVLLRLPIGPWRGIDLYDQSGKRRAWTAQP